MTSRDDLIIEGHVPLTKGNADKIKKISGERTGRESLQVALLEYVELHESLNSELDKLKTVAGTKSSVEAIKTAVLYYISNKEKETMK